MIKLLRAFFLSFTIVAFVLFSTIGTISVRADDGTGTDEAALTEPAPPPDDGQPADTGAEVDQPVQEAAVVTEADQTVEEVTVDAVLEQLPEDTTITVLDAEGEALPLASQEAADTIEAAYDPVWCPADKSPGAAECTGSFTNMTELLTFLDANPSYTGAGTIYIQQGSYPVGESEIDFNDYSLTNLKGYNLTLQGGWDPGSSIPDYTTTEFNIPITIGSESNPWVGSLTINNINISGVKNQTALTLYTEGDILVHSVEITDSKSGADLHSDGNVIVEYSKFDNNGGSGKTDGYGLQVKSKGEVQLYEISASLNEVFGADVATGGDVYVDRSVFSGNVSYSYKCGSKTANGGYGLKVVTSGDIILDDLAEPEDGIQANDNYLFGAYLEGKNVSVAYSTFNNNQYGLKVVAAGDVSFGESCISNCDPEALKGQGVTANGNREFGADVLANGSADVFNSFFNGNKSYTYSCKDGKTYLGYGLKVVSTENYIYLENVTAEGNNLFGAHLDSLYDVTVSGGSFSNNGSGTASKLTGSGLEIISGDTVSLSDVIANNNQLFGADIKAGQGTDADGDVAIFNSIFSGNKSYSYSCKGTTSTSGGYGLKVVTIGDIALDMVTANDNYLFGAYLEGAKVAISATGSTTENPDPRSTFSNNGSGSLSNPVGYGLQIVSTASVALSKVEASNNQLFGANIEAGKNSAAGGDVAILDSFFSGNKSYSYSCKGTTYEGYGLKVVANGGDIDLNIVTANDNHLFGASLQGENVSVGESFFNNNGSGSISTPVGYGLKVVSTGDPAEFNGDVSLSEVQANNNQLYGADVSATGNVYIDYSVFSGNMSYTSGSCKGKTYQGYGLKVVAVGDVKLSSDPESQNQGVTAENNYLYGAHLEGANVHVGNSVFSNNGAGDMSNPTGKGLEVVSTGETTLLNVDASYNEVFGANVQAGGDVKVSNSVFSGNLSYTSGTCKSKTYSGYGLKVVTTKNVKLDTVTANDNGTFGAQINAVDVKVTDSTFNNNKASHGLDITADTVTLNNVTALNNGGNGAKICAKISAGVDASTFENNSQYGLYVGSPVFNEGDDNIYNGNGSGSVFYNTSCVTGGTNNGGTGWNNHGKWGWGWNWGWNKSKPTHYVHFGGSCYKSTHAFAKKW